MKINQKHTPATAQNIHKILGPMTEDALVNSILQLGPSLQEVQEACEWLSDDDYMGRNLERAMSPRSRLVYDLLLDNRDSQERE